LYKTVAVFSKKKIRLYLHHLVLWCYLYVANWPDSCTCQQCGNVRTSFKELGKLGSVGPEHKPWLDFLGNFVAASSSSRVRVDNSHILRTVPKMSTILWLR
jgi:hypothetical protein